jgi:tetrachlorobenzoquinone reductase
MERGELIEVTIRSITRETQDIMSYELGPNRPEQSLPPFTAGAHIDLHLPNGMVRSYSLSNSQADRDRYVVTVARDAASRGGSIFMHEKLGVGDTFPISTPRNNFALDESAQSTLLIGGGIGVTPLWCMAQRLTDLGRPWSMIYCARTRQHAALLEPLRKLAEKAGVSVRLHFDAEQGGRVLDIAGAVAEAAPDTHIYCCGPKPMLEGFEKAAASRPPQQIHVEYFSAKQAPAITGGFTVVLQRSSKEVFVAPGKSILDAVLALGIDVPYSCTEGTCGECETRVTAGIPDHRDSCLTRAQQALNTKMMICVSGSKSEKLVLDL